VKNSLGTQKRIVQRRKHTSSRTKSHPKKRRLVTRRKKPSHPSDEKPWLWKPGQSGNPNGRPPKEVCVTSLIKDILNEEVGKDKKTKAHQLARAIVNGAIGLDKTALKELLARVDGPVQQKVAVEEKVKQILEFVVAEDPRKKGKGASNGRRGKR
jgi:hypothetical protein